MPRETDVPGTMWDTTDPRGTYRPDEPPVSTHGTEFDPLNIPKRDPIIRGLPDTALGIFQRFIPESLVEKWVEYTNEAIVYIRGPVQQQARSEYWTPTSVSELYLFLAIIISIENHPEASIESYWKRPESDNGAVYLFTRHMPLRRFELLLRRVKISSRASGSDSTRASASRSTKGIPRTYQRLQEWSDLQQQAIADIYVPGSHIAVDECVVGFTGRSTLKTTIPNKPTPTGFKVWVVAQDGIFLRWIWHVPGKGPIGISKKPESAEINLNPTQKVVTYLIGLLPMAPYHAFLDNLFSSPNLFRVLRAGGIGASGTARVNSGIYKGLVQAKKNPDHSRPWGWIETKPTPDCQVWS